MYALTLDTVLSIASPEAFTNCESCEGDHPKAVDTSLFLRVFKALRSAARAVEAVMDSGVSVCFFMGSLSEDGDFDVVVFGISFHEAV